MTKAYRLAGAVAAPLILAGCGMPIGVQIVSLLADGVSVIATDKTLTDHGLSAVTEKDCALWRGVKGKDICHDTDDSITTLADASTPSAPGATETLTASIEQPEQDRGTTAATEPKNNNLARRETPEFPTEDPVTAAVAPTPSVVPVETAMPEKVMPEKAVLKAWTPTTAIETSPVTRAVAKTPKAAVRPIYISRKSPPSVTPVPAVPKAMARQAAPDRRHISRQTYFVIASYHRRTAAKRYARTHARLDPQILQGKARGKRVFRVTIGPVARAGRKTTRQFLKKRGFGDAWALTIKTRNPATEVAALR